jgi:hypothetical protein
VSINDSIIESYCWFPQSFSYYATDAVTETGDDIFNEAELNEIKIDGNHEIFEVPEPNGKKLEIQG